MTTSEQQNICNDFFSFNDATAWLSWLSVPGIGQRTFGKLLNFSERRNVTLDEVWSSGLLQLEAGLNEKAIHILNNYKKRFNIDLFVKSILKNNWWIISIKSKYYPNLLKHIPDPPWILFGRGDVPLWDTLTLAIVGTRHPTEYGKRVTSHLIEGLYGMKVMVISGFMYGIDTYAHTAALENNLSTVGVLGSGLKTISPRSQKALANEYEKRGMSFITEFAPDVPAQKSHFPLRNRIVAGLSKAVIIVEAGAQSGSHITARLGVEYGRTVAAIPGSIFSPYSEGTKKLIQEGATLVSSISDVLKELEENYSLPSDSKQESQDSKWSYLPLEQQKVVRQLLEGVYTTEKLLNNLQVNSSNLNITLSLLELAGIIERCEGGWKLSR